MRGASRPLFTTLGALEEPWTCWLGDFDGDGYADVLLRPVPGRSEIWLMGEGGCAASLFRRSEELESEAIGDFDGEGFSDVLWRKREKSLFWFMHGPTLEEEDSARSRSDDGPSAL
jgi:hypothetical protein